MLPSLGRSKFVQIPRTFTHVPRGSNGAGGSGQKHTNMDRGPQVEHLYICHTWSPLIRESTCTAGIKCCPIIAVIGIVSLEKRSEKANLPLQSPAATLLRLPNDAFDVLCGSIARRACTWVSIQVPSSQPSSRPNSRPTALKDKAD